MKLVYADFMLDPCDATKLPRSSIRLGERFITRVPNEQQSHCQIFTDDNTTWACVRYLGHEQAFRVLTLDGAPYTDMDKESAKQRAGDIAVEFADHVNGDFGKAPTF